MRSLPEGLANHLSGGATTLCHCWRLETMDGEAMGFTDHDRTIVFDSLNYEAQAGFSASEIESTLGLSIDNLEVAGALNSDMLGEDRIRNGDFDNATVEIWLVNWQDVSQRLLLRRGHLGEVTRGSLGFSAEIRGLAHVLNQPRGRIYQYGCDAVLGDSRCQVDLDNSAFAASCTILASIEDRILSVSGIESFTEGWFAKGTVTFTHGSNAGRLGEVKFHRIAAGVSRLELWQPMPMTVETGNELVVKAGCDKQFSTCRSKFANALNFRGFPFIPGDDFVLTYAKRDDPKNDGNSRL